MADRGVVFRAVGDIALGDHPLCAGFGTHSRCRRKAPGFAFDRVAGVLRGADIVFGNLECTLSEHGLQPDDYHSMQMRGAPSYVGGLRGAGFNVLNMANNHSMQHGTEPFLETVSMLRQAGIAVCGVNTSDHRRCAPAIVEASGLKVAFLACSMRPRQYFTRDPLYSEGYLESLAEDVAAARRTADAVVVSLHWGDEFIERPSPEEVAFAHRVMDAGADLIVGHHPHVLRGVERYGRGHVVYSLGNFVCDMFWAEKLRETAILECRLSREGVSDLRLTPARINDDHQPVPLDVAVGRPLLERLARLGADLDALRPPRLPAETTAKYREDANRALREERRRAHRYFLKNVYRFPPRILLQQFTTFARHRIAERMPSGYSLRD